MENNKKIEEASKLKEDFTADGVTQEMLELYEKWDMDERTLKKEAREAGMAEGLAEGREKGLAEGRAEGRAQGLAEGKAEGLVEGKIEGEKIGIKKKEVDVIKAMYKNGITIDMICKVTLLTKEEVQKIINSVK